MAAVAAYRLWLGDRAEKHEQELAELAHVDAALPDMERVVVYQSSGRTATKFMAFGLASTPAYYYDMYLSDTFDTMNMQRKHYVSVYSRVAAETEVVKNNYSGLIAGGSPDFGERVANVVIYDLTELRDPTLVDKAIVTTTMTRAAKSKQPSPCVLL